MSSLDQCNATTVPPSSHFSKLQYQEQRLTVKQVADLLQIGVSTVWAMVKDDRLPAPERYGSRCTRWRLGAVLEVLQKSGEEEGLRV